MESIRNNSNGNGRGNGRVGIPNKDNFEQIFEQIYIRNSRRMLAVAYNILHNAGDAQDAVQLSFLKLSEHYCEFRGEGKISTYLHTTVVNESLMMLRHKERKLHKVPLEQECEDGSILILEIPDGVNCGSRHINRINIERAVSHLPDGQRKIWILYDYLGCKHREVAQLLRCSQSNSKSQLHDSRKKLRKALNSQQKLVEKQKKNNNDYNLHDEAASLQQAFLLKNLGLAQYSIL